MLGFLVCIQALLTSLALQTSVPFALATKPLSASPLVHIEEANTVRCFLYFETLKGIVICCLEVHKSGSREPIVRGYETLCFMLYFNPRRYYLD